MKKLFDRILDRVARYAQAFDRRLGQPVKKEEPEPMLPCGGCQQSLTDPDVPFGHFFEKDGVRYHSEDCFIATPTVIRNLRAARMR